MILFKKLENMQHNRAADSLESVIICFLPCILLTALYAGKFQLYGKMISFIFSKLSYIFVDL